MKILKEIKEQSELIQNEHIKSSYINGAKFVYKKLKSIHLASGKIDENSFVYLREDGDGNRYIEYAFKNEEIPYKSCLSWNDKWQIKALKRNHHDIDSWRVKEVNKIYILDKCICDTNSGCDVGKPKKFCSCLSKHWTIDEPIKCACYCLTELERFQLDEEEVLFLFGDKI